MIIELDGEKISSEGSFHSELLKSRNFPRHYGANLDALWDILSTDIERPITLVWKNSAYSKEAMQSKFDDIIAILNRVEKQDVEWKLDEVFTVKIL